MARGSLAAVEGTQDVLIPGMLSWSRPAEGKTLVSWATPQVEAVWETDEWHECPERDEARCRNTA